MRRWLEACVLCLAVAAEPCLHALGMPHPEGLAGLVVTHLTNRPGQIGSIYA